MGKKSEEYGAQKKSIDYHDEPNPLLWLTVPKEKREIVIGKLDEWCREW